MPVSEWKSEQKTEERLTPEMLEQFLTHLAGKGFSQASLQEYRRALLLLQGNLPEGGLLTASGGLWWKQWLERQGFKPRTVNMRVSVWNSLMQYLNHRDWQVETFSDIREDVQPELTRAEYLRLLSAAKQLGQERAYLLIKALGGIGLRIQELSQLTAEAVQKGVIYSECQNGMTTRVLRLPAVVRGELLEYMKREGITKGPIFITSGGKPLDRSNVGQSIKRGSRDARVAEEKANPRCLWKMYLSTQEGIKANLTILLEQAYDRMLEQEQLTTGWENG